MKKPKVHGAIDKEEEKRKKSGLKNLLMMIFGATVVAAAGVMLYSSPLLNQKTTPPVNAVAEVVPLQETTPPPTSEYQFYEILPEQEFRSVPEGISTADEPSEQGDLRVDTVVKGDKPATPPVEEEITVVEENATYDEPEPVIHIEKSNPDITYILQVRTYDNASEADQRRAEVIMAGVDAEVLKRTDSNGSMLYQVVSTPMASRDVAMTAYNRLKSNGIDSVVVEQKRQ